MSISKRGPHGRDVIPNLISLVTFTFGPGNINDWIAGSNVVILGLKTKSTLKYSHPMKDMGIECRKLLK